MFRSNQRISILMAVSILMTGCWKPEKKDDPHNGKSENQASASFFVKDVTGDAANPRSQGQIWKVADKKEFFIRACVTDRKTNDKILGHKFIVEALESGAMIIPEDPEKGTDVEGCFRWKETINYNSLSGKPTYIEYVRRIHGQGVHIGFRDVRLAINPWAGDKSGERAKAVIFLRNGQVSSTQMVPANQAKAALMGDIGAKAQLWMEDINTQLTQLSESDADLRKQIDSLVERKELAASRAANTTDVDGGVLFELLLSMKPRVRVEGLDGNPEFIDLKAGEFDVNVQLIAANAGPNRNERILLTPNFIANRGRIIGSKMETAVRLGVARRVMRGRLEMAVKISPHKLDLQVEPFQAVYVMGDIQNLLQGKPFLSPNFTEAPGKFDYDAYIKSASNKEELAALKSKEYIKDYTPFIFETATVQFAGIVPGETATTRTVEYKAQSCVRDLVTGMRVPFEEFEIFQLVTYEKDADGKDTDKVVVQPKKIVTGNGNPRTNQDGCLVWNSSLTHKYYTPEKFVKVHFEIKHKNLKAPIKKTLVINPWDTMFRTFGFESIEFSESFLKAIDERPKIGSKFFIPQFSYNALRFRYQIDPFMELEVQKLIMLNFRPEVLRYSGIIGGRKVVEPLRDGIYLMKVAIEKDYLDPASKGVQLMPGKDSKGEPTTVMRTTSRKPEEKHFVTVVQKLVRVNGGQINTPVEFSMQDLRLMRIRCQFLVQLQTIDEQLLVASNQLYEDFKKELEELEKTRNLTDAERRDLYIANRASIDKSLENIKSKLANLPGGVINTDELRAKTDDQLKEFDLTRDKANQLISKLRTNEFTTASTVHSVNFDHLIDRDSGLPSRTFLGPIIFLSNSYSDSLRPTDILENDDGNCSTADCDELKARAVEGRKSRSRYDTSEYYGSVAHLKNISVDDLIKFYKEERHDYDIRMSNISSLGNYADIYNLQLIMLGKEQFSKIDWRCFNDKTVKDKRTCQRAAPQLQYSIDSLLNSLNSPDPTLDRIRNAYLENNVARIRWKDLDILRPVTAADFENLATSGARPNGIGAQEVSNALGERLCRLYANNLGAQLAQNLMRDETVADAYRNCLKQIVSGNGRASPFNLDHKLRVFNTGEYVFMGGKQMNVNVGASFNLNQSEDFKIGASAGVNFMDFLGKWAKPFTLRIGADRGFSRSQSDGTTINESTYLVMQSANFAIELKEYQRCTIVRLRNLEASQAYTLMNDVQRDAYEQAIQRGFMICSADRSAKPVAVKESFYYFTQHFTEGDMLDQADLYNHPWLLAMRGYRDFAKFAHLVRAQEFTLYTPFTKVVDSPGWALDQMVDAYRLVVPSFPGLYTVLKPGEGLKDYPFDQTPEEAIAFIRQQTR